MRGSALLGGALLIVLLAQHGARAWHALTSIGWALLPIIALHLVQLALSGAAWHAVAEIAQRIPRSIYVRARWIREGVSCLLPVAQIGGDVVGARLLVIAGARASQAAAGITVDLTVEAVTLVLFTLCGLVFALATGIGAGLVGVAATGLVVLMPGVVALILLQKQGSRRFLARATEWLDRRWPGLRIDKLRGLPTAIDAIYHHPGAFVRGCNLHFLSWLAGILEIWLTALAIAQPVSLGQALIIESLGQAIRGAAFFVPGAIGVQEGGLLLIAVQLGLPADAGLALSLVKRLREIALGLPALAAWHLLEGHRVSTER